MDLEFGLKVTRNNADESSSVNYQFSKDGSSLLFQSGETNTMFVLTAHLRGYEGDDINIDISQDGTILMISGEKTVNVAVIVGWWRYKKGTETRKFRKRFRIPEGVDLDEIKAHFTEGDESVLTVSMPKTVKGISGTVVEEMEEPDVVRQGSEAPERTSKESEIIKSGEETIEGHQDVSKVPPNDPYGDQKEDQKALPEAKMTEEHHREIAKKPDDQETKQSAIVHESSPQGKSKSSPKETEPNRDETGDKKAESSSGAKAQHKEHEKEDVLSKRNEAHEEEYLLPSREAEVEEGHDHHTRGEEGEKKEDDSREKSSMLCTPIIYVGSALFLSLVTILVRYFRSTKQPPRTKN
ncbi:unnamed protein product [Cuscuta europaea]|uniref:SHSP domain-containing protein n=1 Tax=Cuscuta europaea TaxID=41803 RepID=A0A9P0YXM8_CUSEU|nr:unnamed protein product [Cuscuta europaea]